MLIDQFLELFHFWQTEFFCYGSYNHTDNSTSRNIKTM